jgi:2,3,4,5-tetrahydropyridine-2,6-dicarboxylate N-succinyltransferase
LQIKIFDKFMHQLQSLIEAAFADRTLLTKDNYKQAILDVIQLVNDGELRVASKQNNEWMVHQWVKQAILMYFGVMPMKIMQLGPEQYYDKIPLKANMQELGIRTVPGSILRHGAYVSKGVICMPSFINIGAYVDEGTMVDTWATVGSCAQIGKHVHLSGGVGIGGVLEPLQAGPVIIEDNAFIGSRCIVVEGVIVEQEAVLGANVVLTQSTKIIDVSGKEPITYKGRVPARSVVIPGSYTKSYPAGDYQVNCALIIGQRKASTDTKTSLNDALRDFDLSV